MKLCSGKCPRSVLAITVLFLIKQVKGTTQLEKTHLQWRNYKEKCLESLRVPTISTGIYCNRTFDQFVCWPDSPPGKVSVPCPPYLPWLQNGSAGNVYRVCLDQGIWQKEENSTNVWHDRSECYENRHLQSDAGKHTLFIILLYLYTVGYSFSLVSLVLALSILLLLRKLHCTRNYIHMNLFASFILRATGVLIKDSITHNSYSFILEKPNDEKEWTFDWRPKNDSLIHCRMGSVFLHYAIEANCFWLLVEGIYLHRLLVAIVLSEKLLLWKYVFIGWGVPVLIVASWGISRYRLENEGCWARNQNMALWWIIRGPMLFSIAVNFCIFLKIVKLLLSKLKAQQMNFRDYKFRLARSTLVLIPLLGIHDFVFSFIIDDQVEGLSRHIKTFIQLTMDSFHGLLVALLYCFCNGEVKAELRKQWSHFLLAYPFLCMPCFLGKNIKHLGRCPKKQHLSSNGTEVTQPQNVSRTGCNVELDPTLRHNPRLSTSDSSEGEVTTGETIEEVFESEI
ncbi:glucagon-like peptide 2 receptor isoform X1 [Tiliqua scincoides]|uniref:glucagon-like peptide 2 receptor isoform X1 n=1 Tax=Tiliqua scincoides TaxID=71010 RepID=UPI003462DB94